MITMSYSDRCVKNLLEAFDWYILPVANPDGYEYSRSRVSCYQLLLVPHCAYFRV